MNTNTNVPEKRRKFFLVLPLLVLPFLTIGFIALNGGKAAEQKTETAKQLNSNLPDAKLSAEPLDKLSLYNQAKKDSLQNKEGMAPTDNPGQDSLQHPSFQDYRYMDQGYPSTASASQVDANEARVNAKLAELERLMNEPQPAYQSSASPAVFSSEKDLAHIEDRIKSMGQSDAPDPEIEQLNGMLEKIKDIQDPSRVDHRLKELSIKNRGKVYPVKSSSGLEDENPLPEQVNAHSPGFYDLEPFAVAQDTLVQSTIPAVVQGTQTLVEGSTVKMQLSDSIYINGQLIPKGTLISGICNLTGERLKIVVTAIRNNNAIFPVSMTAYDLDALEGIRIPDAIARNATKDGAAQAVQSMQLMSLDPSISAQAAGAGVEAVKGLIGKKVKLIRVTVKAGHPLLLVDQSSAQSGN